MIDMLLNASVSGGIVILLWGLSYPLSRKYFKASWHYAVLKITMIFMVFPVSIFASAFNGMFGELFEKPDLPRIYKIPEQIQMVSIDAETVNSINSALADIVFPAVQYSPPEVQTDNLNSNETHDNIDIADDTKNTMPDIPYLQIIWLVVGTVLFAVEIRKMHRFKKQILSSSNGSINHETSELFLQCKKELRVRSRVTLRTSEYIKTPLAFGLIRPFVVFPETEMSGDEKRIALVHELTHIKNGDLWVKFFASVISAVHWFNPFTHILRRRIAVVSEEYCDECVVKAMTKEERFIYGNLILKVVSDIAIPQSTVCSTLSASTKNLKRRLFNMMNIKKSRKSIIALSVVAAFIFCSFATVYAFAANKAVTLTVDNIDSEELYKEIYDELVNVEKTLKDKFKDSDVTINLSESVDSIVTEEMRENIKNNETSYYEIIEKFKQMMEQFSSNINITTEEMFKQIYEAHPDAKEILDRVQKYWDNTNPVETFKEIYDKPVDLEYFKNWEGWEKEWEKYEKYLEEYKRSYIEKLEESSKKMEKSEEYEKSLKIIEDSRKQFEEMFKLFKRPEYWDTNSWKKIESNMGVMFQLKNGTEIETNGNFLTKQDWYLHNLTTVFKSLEKENPELYKKIPEHLKSFTLMPNSSTALMIPMKKSIVRLDNGITIETPEYTLITVKAIANADHEMKILIGNGNATITQSDGTSTTVPAGTVLDGEGNIIE